MNQLIVIGASAGGVRALSSLVQGLPEGFPAPVLVVLHIGAHRSILPDILAQAGPLPAVQAQEDMRVEPGRIYVAAPDQHLVLVAERLHLSRGAKEHHTRPAIDPLFRSAALAHGPRVIGVVLTGRLDDGTPGLQAIKACGGSAVVQDPADAEEPDMPASALRDVEVDHCVSLEELPHLLTSLASRPAPAPAFRTPPEQLVHEQAIFLSKGDAMEHLAKVGTPSPFVCPDCHGGLWEMSGATPRRFRCHTGHAFTIRTLQDTLATASEESLWIARRALQERLLLLREMETSRSAEAIPGQILDDAGARVRKQLVQIRELMEHGPEPVE